MSQRAAPGTVVRFVLTAVTWGSSFLFIKVGLEGLSPGQVVLCRLVLGAATLSLLMLARRTPWPRDPTLWRHVAVASVLLCVVPFLLFAWSEQHISSSLASILNATTPLQTMWVALLFLPSERPTPVRLAGLATGFAGVLVVLGVWRGAGSGSLAGELACLLATACYGAAFVYIRRFVSPLGAAPLVVAWMQVGMGAVMALALAPAVATSQAHWTWAVAASMLGLGAAGTGMAYVWSTRVVAEWGATAASTVTYLTPLVGVVLGVAEWGATAAFTVTYLTPLVGVVLGVAVLGEAWTWNQPVGAVVTVLGVVVGQGLLSGTRSEPTAASAAGC